MEGREERRSRRLFVAVEVPPAVQAAVDEAVRRWRGVIDARWVPPDARHVTLRFLGSVASEDVAGVRRAVASAAAAVAPVRTRLRGLGAFPSTTSARVLWAGLDDRPGRLAGAALALDAALATEVGSRLRSETRSFRPHLTLGRCDPPARLPAAYGSTEVDPVAFVIGGMVLFESVRGSGRPVYEAMERVDLGA
jgi:RNA 2',3'-cyclic 3'-phosphodiesterase